MKEVEVKLRVPEAQINPLVKKLGPMQRELNQVDTYFNLPDQTQSLRIRQEGDDAFITFKLDEGREAGIVVRYEFEPKIPREDIFHWIKLFESIGIHQDTDTIVHKHREEYEVDGVKVQLDCIEGLGVFVELEQLSDDRIAASAQIEKVIAKLDLGAAERCPGSYRYMLKGLRSASQIIEEMS